MSHETIGMGIVKQKDVKQNHKARYREWKRRKSNQLDAFCVVEELFHRIDGHIVISNGQSREKES